MEELVSPDDQDVDVTPVDTPEDAERAAMGAIFDKAQEEGIEDDAPDGEAPERLRAEDGKFIAKETPVEAEPEVVAEAETPEEAETEAAPEIDVPTFLSPAMRENWAGIPETSRETISKEFKGFSDRLADQGRKLTAIQPIADKVVEAAQNIPGMRDLTPGQIANDVFKMAQIQGELNQNPVEAILKIAAQFGAVDGIKARLEGQTVQDNTPNMVAELRAMRQENERLRDDFNPERINDMMTASLSQRDMEAQLTEFSGNSEHYAAVEGDLPKYIQAVQIIEPEASPQDTLSRTYDMAISAHGLKASTKDSAPKVDPKQTQAAIKAKSVNVKSTSSGKAKPLTEREAMGAVWDRMAS